MGHFYLMCSPNNIVALLSEAATHTCLLLRVTLHEDMQSIAIVHDDSRGDLEQFGVESHIK